MTAKERAEAIVDEMDQEGLYAASAAHHPQIVKMIEEAITAAEKAATQRARDEMSAKEGS